jgi:hypothetical protein
LYGICRGKVPFAERLPDFARRSSDLDAVWCVEVRKVAACGHEDVLAIGARVLSHFITIFGVELLTYVQSGRHDTEPGS